MTNDDAWLDETRDWWHDHIYKEDGTLDERAVLAELHDYKFLMHEAGTVYWSITNGMLSKTNYYASSVLGKHEEYVETLIQEAVHAALMRVKDGEDIDTVLEEFPVD